MLKNLLKCKEVIAINKLGQKGLNSRIGGTDGTDRSNICPLTQAQYLANPPKDPVINALCTQR
ncbi:MAG: hypothetical protein AAFO69_02960 [Bacteroidota bacterium]